MADWVLIFSDGTGQRGVREENVHHEFGINIKNTNVFQMYAAVDGLAGFKAFYDAGLGAPETGEWAWTRTFRNLWSKATGWGITANIVDCYAALLRDWKPGDKIGLFGFSRGAYTARCVGGVLSTCGVATSSGGKPIAALSSEAQREIAEAAVAAYKIKEKSERVKAGKTFASHYKSALVVPDVVGVFDTVKSLGLPGLANIANPWKHEFHDNELSERVPVGLHALSIDENRDAFLPVLWDEPDAEAKAKGQIVEQLWFPGVHSDIGGGYVDDDTLSRLSLAWMVERLNSLAGLDLSMAVDVDDAIHGLQHDERTGIGMLWKAGSRTIRGQTLDIDPLCVGIERRFKTSTRYRPKPLRAHPRVKQFY